MARELRARTPAGETGTSIPAAKWERNGTRAQRVREPEVHTGRASVGSDITARQDRRAARAVTSRSVGTASRTYEAEVGIGRYRVGAVPGRSGVTRRA